MRIADRARRLWYRLRRAQQVRQIEHLQAAGMRIGRNVVLMDDVVLDSSVPWLIEIGDYCRLSSGTRVMAHDATTYLDLGVTRIAPVRILAGSFIGERTLILPGVTIGPRTMIAAGSVVNRDIPEGMIAAGNPARPYGRLDEMLARIARMASEGWIVSSEDINNGAVTPARIHEAMAQGREIFVTRQDPVSPYHVNLDRASLEKQVREAFATHFGAPR